MGLTIDERLDRDNEKITGTMRKYLTKNWGTRCPDYDPLCALCKVWVRYDLFCEAIDYQEAA